MEGKSTLHSSKEQQLITQLIVFRVGDEEFGVPISDVQEIIKVSTVTPIPDSPAFIKGLINVRGDIVAVIDVRARFFLTSTEEVCRHIIIAQQEGNFFGLLVNEVMEVLRIQESEIKPPPRLMIKINEDYVRGVVTHDNRLVILLDLNHVLSEDELIKLSDTARGRNHGGTIAAEEIAIDDSSEESDPKANVAQPAKKKTPGKKRMQE